MAIEQTQQEVVQQGFWPTVSRGVGTAVSNLANFWVFDQFPEQTQQWARQYPTPGYPANPSNPAVGDPSVIGGGMGGFNIPNSWLVVGGIGLVAVILLVRR